MKKITFKKSLALILSVMLIIAALPISAISVFAADVPAELTLDSVESYLAELGEEEPDAAVKSWLKSYFVSGATLTYKAADLANYPNVKAYFADGILTAETDTYSYGRANQMMLGQNVLATGLGQNITMVIDNTTPTQGIGYNIIPALQALTYTSASAASDVTIAKANDGAFYPYLSYNAKTFYIDAGVTAAENQGSAYYLSTQNFKKNYSANYTVAVEGQGGGNGSNFQKNASGKNINNYADYYEYKSSRVYSYIGDYIAVNINYTFEDASSADSNASDSNGAVKATNISHTITVWAEDDGDGVYEDGELSVDALTYIIRYRYAATENVVPYFSMPASAINSGEVALISIESELPKDDLFLAHCEANKNSWTVETLDEAAELYNGIADENKANADIAAAYADVKAAVKKLFIVNGKLEYTNTYPNLTSVLFEAEDEGYLKVSESDISSSIGQKVKVAFDYTPESSTPGIGMDILPTLSAVSTDTTTPANRNLFYLGNRSMTINGASGGIYGLFWKDYGTAGDLKTVYKSQFNAYAMFGNDNEFTNNAATNYATMLENYNDSTTLWKYKGGNNIVMEIYYFYKDCTDSDAVASAENSGIKATQVTMADIYIWVEADGNNTYNSETDLLVTGGSKLNLTYRYADTLNPVPYLSFTNSELLNYVSVENLNEDYRFTVGYQNLFNSESPKVSEVLPMLKAFGEIENPSSETKALVKATADKLNLLPENNGATIRTDAADQNIAFYGKLDNINGLNPYKVTKIGVVMDTYNNMKTIGDKELTLETAGVSGELTLEEAGSIAGREFMFTLTGTDVKNQDKWGYYIVSRVYVEYTNTSTGESFIVYSLNTDTKNPVNDDFVASTSVRCVNGVIKNLANGVKSAYDNSVEGIAAVTGLSYKDIDGQTVDTYKDVTLEAAYTDIQYGIEDGKKSTAVDTLYFLMAYINAVALAG